MAKIKAPLIGEQLDSLGEFIAAQRRSAELSLRQLAEQSGISNPYLSQIERGLRRPSAEVLQQLSKALRVSAETLYVRAGILDPRDHATTTVEMVVLADPSITERQKRVLIDVYASFVKENAEAVTQPDVAESGATESGADDSEPSAPSPRRTAAPRKAAARTTTDPKKAPAPRKRAAASASAPTVD